MEDARELSNTELLWTAVLPKQSVLLLTLENRGAHTTKRLDCACLAATIRHAGPAYGSHPTIYHLNAALLDQMMSDQLVRAI